MEELKRIIDDSEITKEDDALWPPPDRVGRQVGVSATIHRAEILQIRWGLLLCMWHWIYSGMGVRYGALHRADSQHVGLRKH